MLNESKGNMYDFVVNGGNMEELKEIFLADVDKILEKAKQ